MSKLIDISIEERRQLALDLLDCWNLQPNLWERKSSLSVIAEILHQVTDPRNVKRMQIRKGTSAVACLKKNNIALLAKLDPFLVPLEWSDRCVCGHYKSSHYRNTCDPECSCKKFKSRGL